MTDSSHRPLPRILLVSCARSGTTHLVRLMNVMRRLYVVKNEWLEGLGVAWAQEEELAAFRQLNGVNYTSYEDPRLRAWVRDNMELTLQTLEGLAHPKDRAVLYKSFASHVPAPDFDRLFYNRPDTKFIFLKRRPIDAYISLIKAKAIEQWVDTDTTGLKPELDPEHFLRWWALKSDWFTGLEARLIRDDRPYGALTYEEDVMGSVSHLVKRTHTELQAAGFDTQIDKLHLSKIHLKRQVNQVKADAFYGDVGAVKQDKETNTAAKVSNWDGFTDVIGTKLGSLEALDVFKPQADRPFWSAASLPEEWTAPATADVS